MLKFLEICIVSLQGVRVGQGEKKRFHRQSQESHMVQLTCFSKKNEKKGRNSLNWGRTLWVSPKELLISSKWLSLPTTQSIKKKIDKATEMTDCLYGSTRQLQTQRGQGSVTSHKRLDYVSSIFSNAKIDLFLLPVV